MSQQNLAINPEVLNQTFETNWDSFNPFLISMNVLSVKDRNLVHTEPVLARTYGYNDVIVPANQVEGRALTMVRDKVEELKALTGTPIHRSGSWKSKSDLLVGQRFRVKFRITKARPTPLGTVICLKLEAYTEPDVRFAFGEAGYFVFPISETCGVVHARAVND